MPENENPRRPFESIKRWRDRLLNKNKYGNYGGELNPSYVVADRPEQKPTGNWFQRIRKFRHPYGTHEDITDTYNIEERGLSQDVIDNIALRDPKFAYDVFNRIGNFQDLSDRFNYHNRRTDEYRGNYASSLFPFVKNSGPNDMASQLWRWYSRKWGFNSKSKQNIESFSGTGTDIIDLDKNVIRVGPKTKQSTALFNEFVENKYPSVHKASEYQQGNVPIFGDLHRVPIENISLFAGIEDGHFKLDSLQNFNPETTIFPARNIRKGLPKISKLVIKDLDTNAAPSDYYKENLYRDLHKSVDPYWFTRSYNTVPEELQEQRRIAKDQYAQKIDSLLASGNTLAAAKAMHPHWTSKLPLKYSILKSWNNWNKRLDINSSDAYEPKFLQRQIDSLQTLGRRITSVLRKGDSARYFYVDTNGEEHPISDYRASILDSKMILGNPNGGKFIGKIQDIAPWQLDSINNWLAKNPSQLLLPDLGSFGQYRLNKPTASEYLEQFFEHPRTEDPNVFIVGTTEPNKSFE